MKRLSKDWKNVQGMENARNASTGKKKALSCKKLLADALELLKEQKTEIEKTRETIEEFHKIADEILAKRS